MVSQTKTPTSVQSLIDKAIDENLLTSSTLDLLKAGDLGTQIQAGLGVGVDDHEGSEAILVASILDDSGSISGISGGPDAVCKGQNMYVNAFQGSKQQSNILIGTWVLNQDAPIHPFVPVSQAILLENGKNYSATGSTPLFRQTCAVLSTLALKMKVEYDDANCPCRAILLIVTDGADYDGRTHRGHAFKASDCKKLVDELGEDLIVQFMGIDDGYTDFKKIAESMGVKPHMIRTPSSTDESAIRKDFQMFSQSAVRASQTAQHFSQVAAGGFGS